MLYAPLAVKRLVAAVCVCRPYAAQPNRSERVSRRGPRRGSGAGLDAGASGDYRAWPFKDGKPQRPEAGQGSGSRATPAREASPAMGSLPQRPDPRHTARPVKDQSNHNPFRLAGVRGRPAPRVDASPRQLHQAHACAFRSGSDPRNPLMRWMGDDRNQWPGQSAAAPVLSASPLVHVHATCCAICSSRSHS